MALESLPKIAPALFSAEQDLIQIYNKKSDTTGVINPSYIKSSPSGGAGAIQFSDGSAFASDASNLFWDNVNKRLGVGTPSPTAKVNIVDNVGGTGNALLISHPSAPATLSYNPNASALILSGGYSYLAINTFGGGSNALTLGSGGPQGYLDLKENGTTYVSLSGTSTGNAGYSYFLSQLGVGTATTLGAKMNIKGSGSTSATTSLLVQNSSGSNALKVRDDGKTAFGNSSIDCTITGTSSSGNKFEFYAFNGYDIVDGFGNVLVTGLGSTIRLPRQVGIGFNTQNNASAILQADSTTQGFLPPRMTDAQIRAIASPAVGLMAYNTDLDCPVFYSAAGWRKVSHSVM